MSAVLKPEVAIFTEAVSRPSTERDVYLDLACAGDVALRARVDALLRAHEEAEDFLRQSPEITSRAIPPLSPGPQRGEMIDRYRLLEQIGEGGCGIVFVAEQEQPMRRRVALKVIKPGMDTRSVIARFEAERQALALMDHPNIAKVLDAGTTTAGRPYFVMELVQGLKLTEFCDRYSLSTAARLDLFVQVCQAVQHAHQKGIIHRDLKPSNILVSTEEGSVPKVIDFGIAKATSGPPLTDKTVVTAVEMLMGTPAYMSPEQAALSNVDVDTRTDIYSLGVLLYELLTSTTPFNATKLLRAGLDEIRRAILNQEPERPSTRLGALPVAHLTTVAQKRQAEAPKLIRTVRGDLDWIVLKALEKDRGRRYQTAASLAEDIERFLANEPVAAGPPGAIYRVGKWVQRNKLAFAASVAVLLSLVAGLSVAAWMFAKERQARGEADQARRQAELDKRQAEAAATKSQQVTSFLQEMLHGVDPAVALGRDTTLLREIVDRTAARVASELTNQPTVEADLRLTLGEVYEDLGAYPEAGAMLKRVLEINQQFQPENRIQRATALHQLGLVLLREHKLEEAERLTQESLALWGQLDQEQTDPAAVTLENLAMIRWQQGRFEEAEAILRRVYSLRQRLLPADSADLLNTLSNLGNVLYGAKRYVEAEQLYRQLLETKLKQYGESHPSVALAMHNLGVCLSNQHKFDEAKSLLTQALALRRRLLGDQHPFSIVSLGSLADVLQRSGSNAEAAVIYRETLAWERKQWGTHHPSTVLTAHDLARTLHALRNYRDLQILLDDVLTPEFAEDPKSRDFLFLRSDLLGRAGRWKETAADAAKLVKYEPEEHQHYHSLAPALVATGNAEAYAQLCHEMIRRFAGATSVSTADRMAKDSLILPVPGLDLDAVTKLADFALTKGKGRPAYPFYQFCKALAEYRQGRFAAAAELAAAPAAAKFPYVAVEAGAVLAMAQQQLQQPELARTTLAKAESIFASKLPKLESGELGGDWRDWIVARALLQEAAGLIEAATSPGLRSLR